ncbi:HK97 gp10 family phage protein [Burkholderia contaminans]|uniref:HK97 gp10 family phage protein n=1 Tax=Burkholderia contaminans TaxID=488447 RepID=A0A3N8QRQ4_9BURK|nr:HK97 gp10 family phage protein [Burkholderia contaminans]RQT26051.1 HK97 gp10 family phage protein [Burkholderia contaminans]
MGLVKSNFSTELLAAQLAQLGERSSRKILTVMRDEAQTIARLAKENAPHKDGDLEEAIHVVEDRGGMNNRTQVTIEVDPAAVDAHGRRVAEYAAIMHEGLAPYGTGAFKLDDGSIAKDAGSGKVGGKFLERAVRSRLGPMGKKVKAIIAEEGQ